MKDLKNLRDLVEGALKEIEWIKNFIDQVDMVIIVVTKDTGRFLFVNEYFKKVTGWSFKELTETEFINFVHPEDVERTMKAYQTNMQDRSYTFCNRYRCKWGGYITLCWSKAVIDVDKAYISSAIVKE